MLSHPMLRPRRVLLIAALLAATAGGAAACGEEGISSSLTPEQHQAAQIFNERCSGCHTLNAVGTQGSSTNIRTREYKDGPNFDQRKVTKNCALYAIRNGGFSSGPMPQDIVVGADAVKLANFLAEKSGSEVINSPGQGSAADTDCPPAN
jgi:mono/diheme cytochrome c family protein